MIGEDLGEFLVNGWMDEWMDGWMDGWMDIQIWTGGRTQITRYCFFLTDNLPILVKRVMNDLVYIYTSSRKCVEESLQRNQLKQVSRYDHHLILT